MRDRNGLTLHSHDSVIVDSGGTPTKARILQILEKRPFGPSAFGDVAMVVWPDGKSHWMGGDVLAHDQDPVSMDRTD